MPVRLLSITLAAVALAAGAPAPARAQDPLVHEQWGLGSAHAIGVPAAWQQTHGAGVVVAVLDSGVQLDHPDLAPNLWTNPGEVPGNGVDDDHDGYVDDVHGANIIGSGGEPFDDNGHGTHVAGIVAAVGGNGIGGSGVAPEARIMAVKILDARRIGDNDTLARGIRYAIAHGAAVMNISVTGSQTNPDLEAAIAEADRAGITVVAAAGNGGSNIDVRPAFPAALPAGNVVSVTATDPDGARSVFANYGRRSVDLAAPGEGILSTMIGAGWDRLSGTSMAAPFVTGAFALLAAAYPALPAARLREALLTGARRERRLRRFVGAGRLDVPRALRRARALAP